MANYNQFSRVPVQGGDIPFHNYGGSDIDAGLAVLLDASNDGGIVLPTASGGVTGSVGVTVDKVSAGTSGRVQVLGVAVCKAAGSVTAGDEVMISDTTAKLGWVKTKTAGGIGLGQALNSAADGFPVRVLLSHAVNA